MRGGPVSAAQTANANDAQLATEISRKAQPSASLTPPRRIPHHPSQRQSRRYRAWRQASAAPIAHANDAQRATEISRKFSIWFDGLTACGPLPQNTGALTELLRFPDRRKVGAGPRL